MLDNLRHLLIGPPLPTQRLATERLNKVRALAAFSPDALSSIAYANQEIFLGLVVAGAAGLHYAWPIGIAITVLLGVLALSYYQTVHAYPGGGGSYTVARENLGALPGLIAAAALLIDYVLTAAVSLTAGVAAIASAFPALWPYRVEIALVLLVIITAGQPARPARNRHVDGDPGLFLSDRLSADAGDRIGSSDREWADPARNNRAPAARRGNTVLDPAYLRRRLHGLDGHRSDQQWRARFQAAGIPERGYHADRDGGVDGHLVSGQHRTDAISGRGGRTG